MKVPSTKAQQITQCLEAVSTHFKCAPLRVLNSFNKVDTPVKNARNLLWYHLHDCGMSYNAIGRIFNLSDVHIASRARQGMLTLMDEDRALLDTLPRIANTLDIESIPRPCKILTQGV